ncbi:10157_t:CDS:2, partial [Cetraspora pellucida]
DDHCKIEVYQECQLKKTIEGASLNDVWQSFEINAWCSMFRAAGTYNITPWSYEESKLGFLTSIPLHMPNATHTFWNLVACALSNNKKILDRK